MRFIVLFLLSSSCSAADERPPAASTTIQETFSVREVASFSEPWAMTYLPDGRLLVTEKRGALKLVTQDGEVAATISGVPDVA